MPVITVMLPPGLNRTAPASHRLLIFTKAPGSAVAAGGFFFRLAHAYPPGSFEEAWRAGRRPRLEDFIDGAQGSERLTLLRELLRLEVHYRRLAGEGPAAADYQMRFPEATALLPDLFAVPLDTDRLPAAPEPLR
jgi:hypothetical protein